MDPITLITFGAALIKEGIATFQQIRNVILSNQGDMTEEQVNAILDALIADDDKRAQMAEDIANGK